MNKKIHIVYLTTNLINGKQYVGDHSTFNINDNYFGSGILVQDAFKKYGKKNFKKEILEKFDTKQDAFNTQQKYINKFNTLEPYGYNISPTGGLGLFECHTEKTKQKIANSVSKKMKGRIL
jgi:group I intron endonuclease